MDEPVDTVLVVDDAPSKRYILGSWLHRAGYAVEEASTGAEALARVRRGGIGLVVLDVRLPDRSGYEVCEEIKADPVHGATPVIHVSATATESVDRTQGLERGADAYLVEPIDPGELLATITSVRRYYQARLNAEKLAGRLTDLARAGVAMTSATNQRDLLEVAGQSAAMIFDSPAVLIATLADGAQMSASVAGPDEPVEIRPWTVDAEPPTGVAFYDDSPDAWPSAKWPSGGTVRVLTVRSLMDGPGVFVVVPTEVTMEGAPVLTLFGQAVLSAMSAMRQHDHEHELALTLQRSLLPRRLPELAEFDLAVRYVPAGDLVEIGGDFYEVTRLGGQLMVAVGDVGGHSLHAATIMAELRHATRAYLAEGHGPAAVVDRLKHLMAELIPGEIATLCLLAIEIATGRARLANAGHPPPVVNTRSGVRTIDQHGPLLGVSAASAVDVELTIEPGDTLVLYTDGLLEVPGESLDRGLARLSRAAESVEPDLEAFASRLLSQVGSEAARDDIAMVVIRRSSP